MSSANGLANLNGEWALTHYMDLLMRDAFVNFRTLIEDVTLSPSMGGFLGMVGNARRIRSPGSTPTRTTPGNCCSCSPSAPRAEPRWHADARCGGPADPDLRPDRGAGLCQGVHRLDLLSGEPAVRLPRRAPLLGAPDDGDARIPFIAAQTAAERRRASRRPIAGGGSPSARWTTSSTIRTSGRSSRTG